MSTGCLNHLVWNFWNTQSLHQRLTIVLVRLGTCVTWKLLASNTSTWFTLSWIKNKLNLLKHLWYKIFCTDRFECPNGMTIISFHIPCSRVSNRDHTYVNMRLSTEAAIDHTLIGGKRIICEPANNYAMEFKKKWKNGWVWQLRTLNYHTRNRERLAQKSGWVWQLRTLNYHARNRERLAQTSKWVGFGNCGHSAVSSTCCSAACDATLVHKYTQPHPINWQKITRQEGQLATQ